MLFLYLNSLRCNIFDVCPTEAEGWSRYQLLRSLAASAIAISNSRDAAGLIDASTFLSVRFILVEQ